MKDGVGPCWRITYSRADFKDRCVAIKFAHDEKTAIRLLTDQMKKKNITLTSIEATREL